MLRAARWYAELGYAVFPCAPGRKVPLTKHGLLEATTKIEQITEWWTQQPHANVAIRTDGLLVVDIDGEGNAWLTNEPAKLAEFDSAPVSLTPHGGRHHFFRQPAGRAWRNTVGKIAEHVDTRARGGYVLVAPSVVEGTPYRWQEEHELSVPPHKLPEPPAWLVDLLDASSITITRTIAGANIIPQRQRNDTLARLAGALRRIGLSQAEIFAALRQVNADRCAPPLEQREVERVAASIARYEPNAISVALIEDHFGQDFIGTKEARPLTVGELLLQYPMLRPPVIIGLLRQGETMNLVAPPKTGKSWLVLALAMAVATGRPWLNTFETVAGRVLILDNELHRETIAHRIPRVAEALGIDLDKIRDRIEVHSLRGQLRDILTMTSYFDTLAPGSYSLVILDAMYRFMPVGADENDNGTMASIYNRIDAFADRLGCCFVLVHHTTKGNQSAKSITDVGAGAGSQSRATDTHVIMRPHEEPGAVVLDAAARSWPPIQSISLRWLFPLWNVAPDLDPTMLRSEKPKRIKPPSDRPAKASAWSVERFVNTFISDHPATKAQIREAAKDEPGLSLRRIADLLDIAESQGKIHRWRIGRSRRVFYATVQQSTECNERIPEVGAELS